MDRTLHAAVLYSAGIATNTVDSALRENVLSAQVMSARLRQCTVALQHEVQLCRDAIVALDEADSSLPIPLKETRVPGCGGRVREEGACTPAILAEAAEIHRSRGVLASLRGEIANMIKSLVQTENTTNERARWVQQHILRDNDCLASIPARSKPAPSRHTQTAAACAVAEREGATPRAHPTPHPPPQTARVTSATSPSDSTMNLASWQDTVNALIQANSDAISSSVFLRRKASSEATSVQLACTRARKAVLDSLQSSMDRMLREKQIAVAEMDSTDRKLQKLQEEWRDTSEAAKLLKMPMAVARDRKELRGDTTDHVGQLLIGEQQELVRGRHELKKKCRLLVQQMGGFKEQRERQAATVKTLTNNIESHRCWMELDCPIGVGSASVRTRAQAKKMFPDLRRGHALDVGDTKRLLMKLQPTLPTPKK